MAFTPMVRKGERAPCAACRVLAALLVFYVLVASATALVQAAAPAVIDGMTIPAPMLQAP